MVFRPREAIPETMNNAFFSRSESMVDENDSFRSIQGLIGTFQFPENAILSDSKRVNRLYNYLIERQVGDDPVIRTADLPNPFNFSVQTLPVGTAQRLNGSEFVFERAPETAVPAPTPIQPAVPVAPAAPSEPIQAKF
ncbi:hypothetical protein [Romeriopsis navalis]|uniref:hypothetical protein n=1 Tax=Romeriopsis navalis TaxID=2992132 RepID=UPI0021F90C23|nr:hypothetical protein [Romeriopsis navalis]